MNNNFEQPSEYDAHLERADIDAAYEKAQKILSDPINPEDFADIYGDNVEKDMHYVEEMEKKFEHDNARLTEQEQQLAKVARIFEAIVFQHAELSNWFGASATTIQNSRFDDIANGIDTTIEFEEEQTSHHLALAIDVTTSASIGEKFARIKKEINEGHLAEIKYFVSEHLNIRGHKSNIPRVVIGADRKTIYNVVNAWLENDMGTLAQHPIQIKILSEIKMQLEAFKAYCEKNNHPDLAQIYDKGLVTISNILEEKDPSSDQMYEIGLDDVYAAIERQTMVL